MIDPSIPRQVREAARAAAERAGEVDVDDWLARLRRAAASPLLDGRIALARSHRWAGAIPTGEPVDLAAPANAPRREVIGVDGSQIYPQKRSPFQWAYVQAVAYQPGRPPLFVCRFEDVGTAIFNGSRELSDHRDELTAIVNAWRTLLEMQLARMSAQAEPEALALFDNGLLPWLSVGAERYLREYLADLLAVRPGLIAGVISGPQSRLLSRLVCLVEAENVEAGLEEPGILDTLLMRRLLRPGERSAIFQHGSPRNDVFTGHGAGVNFFFLRVDEREIARVEIPAWVAEEPRLVDTVHSTVLADSQLTGYSYALSQAHAHAVIPLDIGRTLNEEASATYWQATGRLPVEAAKAAMKAA